MEYAISLHQPWASFIAHGIKRVETRTWFPPDAMIGQLVAIHASANPSGRAQLWNSPTFRRHAHLLDGDGRELPMGAVIAVARITNVGVVRDKRSFVDHKGRRLLLPPEEIPYGNYPYGGRLWVLSDVARLTEPVPMRGYQRFWKLTPEQLAAIWNQSHIHVSGDQPQQELPDDETT